MKTQTADLFTAPAPAPAPASAPAPALRLPTPQTPPAPRSTQLWYAVVFAPPAPVLQRLSLHAQQFTSLVSLEAPNALLLEVKGSLKLFGPLEHLQALIDARWRSLGLQAASAVAPSTLAALWCARAGKSLAIEDPAALAGRLAQLPIACTAWDADRLQTLHSMGITRLGELLRLPRAGLARRLGPAAVLDLDIALARQPGPRRAFVARQRFRERCEFETEIDHVAYLGKALEPLVGRCAQFLRERQAGVQTLALKLRHRAGPATQVRLGLASVTSERRRLADVLDQQLSRLELRAPVRALELASGALQPLSAVSLDAFSGFGNAGGPDTAAQLVERLRARLGEHAVYGVSTIPEHRPEAAWRRVHELQLDAAFAIAADRPHDAMPRPVWLLDEPSLLSRQEALQPNGWILEQGPERIESGWWDGKGVARDYYCARQARGAKLWIFQERHTKCWYLHGVFA
ncbi:MAG: DNA polymerase Y family protein [Steroidobacteraceae bacterium]